MARNNNSVTMFKTDYDFRKYIAERQEAIKNKEIDQMTKEDFIQYLDLLTNSTKYIEKSSSVIINTSKDKWKFKKAKSAYKETNEKIDKLNKTKFFDVIANKNQNAEELLYKTLKFNDLNNKMVLSEQKGGIINESLYSFKEGYEYLQMLKEKANPTDEKIKAVQTSLFGFDLETTGGLNTNGVWEPDSITEFSLQEWDLTGSGKRIRNDTLVIGLTKEQGDKLKEEFENAINNGALMTNDKLRISAVRYSLYGDDKVTFNYDEEKGIYKIGSFIDSDLAEPQNKEKIFKGIDRFVEVGERMKREAKGGIRADHRVAGEAMRNMMDKINNDVALLSGYNHLGHDIPIMQNQLLKWHNMYKDKTDLFNIDMDMDAYKTIDLFGAARSFIEYHGVKNLYPGSDMDGAKKVAGQEYMVQLHLKQWFEDNNLQPHKAEDDVFALLGLFTQNSDLLNTLDENGKVKGTTVLDYISENLNKVKHTDTVLDTNKHILRAKRRAASQGGKGYINFAMGKDGTKYTASNHIIGSKDGFSNAVGGAIHEDFNVGFGVNKGAFYEIDTIQKIGLTDDVREMLADLAPEYSGKNLYHVQLSMATTDKYKDTRLGDLKQNFFFKNEKELQGWLSSYFDVVAKKTEDGVKIFKNHLDKFDIRELQSIKGEARFVDVNNNSLKSHQQLFDEALDFSAEKILTSRAENALLRDTPYEKLNKALNLEKELLDFFKDNNIDKKSVGQREINQIMSGRIASGEMAININEEQLKYAQGIINNALSYTRDINGQKIERILDSSIDNYSSIMTFIDRNKTVLNTIKNELESKIGKDAPSQYKQEVFARIYDAVKREVADHIYRNSINTDSVKARDVLTDKRLQSSIHEFSNVYEIDYSSITKDNKIKYVSITQPESLTNVYKFDVSAKGSMYSMIDKATQSVFGKDAKNITTAHKQVAMEELFIMLNREDEALRKTKVFKSFRKEFMDKGKFVKNAEGNAVNFLNIADTIVQGMQEVKSKDKFAGFKNLKHAFMKSLEGSDNFIAALNSEKVQEQVGGIAQRIIDNFDMNIISASTNSKDLDHQINTIVDDVLMKHYAPSLERAKQAFGGDLRKEMLYNKGRDDIRTYLTDVIKGFSFIEGTEISVQNDGALLITNGDRREILSNLPKMKLDDDSGVLYLQVGNQKLQFNKKVILKSGNNIEGSIGTNISKINEFSNSKFINKIVAEKGIDAGIDKMFGRISSDLKSLREGPTINNFGGNDIDSNYNVDLSDVKNILVDLFGDKGRFNHYLDDVKFMDQNLKDTLKEKLKRVSLDENGNIKDLSPDITRDIAKDIFHILDVVKDNGKVDKDFREVLKNVLGFTGQEKKVSGLIAYEGSERPTNSTFGSFDNTQRPPITQSGNAKFLRIDDIDNARKGKANVIAGNIISSASTDRKIMREFTGVGKATTDVMLDTYYVSTNALKVLTASNFDDVIEKATVEYGTEEAVKNAYKYIRDSVSTFEQERIMDSRIHESIYGLQSAATQKLSKGTDIVSIVQDLEDGDLKKQMDLIGKHRGHFKIEGDDIIYKSSIGRYVRRGEGTIKSKGFADLTTSFSSKVRDGVFNFNYYNSNGMKLKDSEINKIIKQNKNKFMVDGKFVEKELFGSILDSILEESNIVGQYAIEDIAALGYAKTMTSGAEKGMTDILYATTGRYNKYVEKVFKNINMWDNVKSKVLTNEAVDALLAGNNLKEAFAGTSFKTVDDLKKALSKERHMHSNMLFSYALGDKTHLIANDNVLGHANFGAMYQGSLSKAIDLLSKNHKDGLNGAVQTIVDMINEEGEFKNSNGKFQFMENWNIKGNKINASSIGVRNEKGRIIIDDEFLTSNNALSSLNSTKFNNVLREIDKRYLQNETGDNRLVRKDVYMLKKQDDGSTDYELVKEVVGAFYSREIDGKTVLLGAQTKENVKYVTDVETQTGVTDEYFTLKKYSTDLKKKKIGLEQQLNSTNNAKEKSKITKDLLSVKNELSKAQDELADYEGTVKIMRFGDQELSIVNRIAITQANIDQMNDLMNKGELDANILNSYSLKGRINTNETGRIIGSSDFDLGNKLVNGKPAQGEGFRALDWFTNNLKKEQWFNSVTDVELTKDLVSSQDYAHLKDVFEHFNAKDQKIGIDKAEEVLQARLAIAAKDFNSGYKRQKDIDEMLEKGFKIKNINDLAIGAEDFVEDNLIIDLGSNFSDNNNLRYIAVPGTGKIVMDEEIRKKSHSSLVALKHRYDEYMVSKGNEKEETTRLFNSIKSLQEDIAINIDKELFNKNGILHNMSRINLTTPSYRNKLSGFISDNFDDELYGVTDGLKVNFINSRNSDLTRDAMIDGQSIADLERSGRYYDYKFVSREQFENMGYFKKDTLKQFGFVDDEAGSAISKMEDHLRRHGTIDMFDRYPNTRTGSIAPSHVFLDDRLQGNQSKVSVSLAMKANADYDGDSGSNFLLRFTDDQGRKIDGAYYTRVRSIAIDNLEKQGKEINATSIAIAAEETGMISRGDFENFHKLQAQMTTASATDNIKWAEKGKKIITKDNLKNVKIGYLTNASMVENAYSDFLGTNVITRLSEMPSLDDFYETEKSANEVIKKAQELQKANNINLSRGNDEEAWQKFNEITDIRLSNSSESMDKSLAILEKAVDEKLIDSSYLENAKAVAIKKISHDKYSQEIMAKTGLAATGNVNLVLNSVKLATQFTENDPSQIRFTNFIWEGLDTAEQGIISSKKIEGGGFDDTRIEGFTEAMNNIFKSKNKADRDLGRRQLGEWMDANAGDVFETTYNEMGKYILGSKNYNAMSKEQGIKEIRNKFLNFVTEKSEDRRFMSVVASLDAIGRNGSHDANLDLARAAAVWENSFKASTLNAVGYSNEREARSILERQSQQMIKENKMAMARMDTEEAILENSKQMIRASASETTDTIMKHMPRIPMTGNGLGMAVLGTAAGLLVSGYASGNPLRDKQASQVAEEQTQPKQTMTVPQFMEQGGMVTGNSQTGYVINLQADTKKGRKYMQRMMSQAAQASVGGAVSVNMNLRDVSNNGITDKDIEDYMSRYL